MQDRRVRRRWGATLLGSLATLALAAGCTGDEGVQVVTDDVDGAAALAAAVEPTPTSGRFRYEMDTSMPGPDDAGWSMRTAGEGEFAGDDLRIRLESSSDGGVTMSGETVSDVIVVDGRQFHDVASRLAIYDGWIADGATPGLEAAQEALAATVEGKDWIESAAMTVEDDELDGDGLEAIFVGGPASLLTDPAELLDDLDDVRELDAVERDGESLRRFAGTVRRDSMFGPGEGADDPELSAEDRARLDRIDEYAWSHTESSVEVLVGPDGYIRGLQLEVADDFEPEYRDCMHLSENGSLSMTIELFDLGEPIEIVAPDPATVIDESALNDLGGVGVGPDDVDSSFGSLSSVEMFGREATEQVVADGAALIALDPATIPSLTDEQLDEVIAQIELAAAALPTFDTRVGQRNRPEMIELIRMGTTMLGIEPLDLSGYSDQQLADLINSYLDEYGFAFGGDDEEHDDFEGCPA